MEERDALVIGGGVSGAIIALELAHLGFEVLLVAAGCNFLDSSSAMAQGGIIYRGKNDSECSLTEDILKAGAGLSYPGAVDQLVRLGPGLVRDLLIDKYQVPFDRTTDDALSLTEEAAHSCPRILHVRDQTGAAIMKALFEAVAKCSKITLKWNSTAVDLITLSHHSKRSTDIYAPSTCVGAYVMDNQTRKVERFFARETILATGGLGEVFLHSTNPQGARGDGVAMAFRAGARIMNMEYVQFHPTALYEPHGKRFLISEALRGEGAELLSSDFKPYMQRYHEKGALAPRDSVARSTYQEMVRVRAEHLWLDISHQNADRLKERFPFIYTYALSKGFDLTKQPLPIVPAAHYSCGGIAVDVSSKTTIHRLRAIGEVACTGLHGANRLASTSLLEALVWGKVCAADIALELAKRKDYFPPVDEWVMCNQSVDAALIEQDWMTIKQTMWNYVGLVRDKQRLCRALKMLQELQEQIESFYEKAQLVPELLALRNGVQTALLITQGALRNKHSLGCHFRLN
jgi:L-aspartate oxidase